MFFAVFNQDGKGRNKNGKASYFQFFSMDPWIKSGEICEEKGYKRW